MKIPLYIILFACLILTALTSLQTEEKNGFFLSQFFYSKSITNDSKTKTEVNIVRIEVWMTNRTNTTGHIHNVVGFMDLGEEQPYSKHIVSKLMRKGLPHNEANDLYSRLTSKPLDRLDGRITNVLTGPEYNFIGGQDFQKAYARKLSEEEFTFNSHLGTISVKARLNPNDVLAVAYQYECNGYVFKVGEFEDDIPSDSGAVQKDLFLKLLKGVESLSSLPISNLKMNGPGR